MRLTKPEIALYVEPDVVGPIKVIGGWQDGLTAVWLLVDSKS